VLSALTAFQSALPKEHPLSTASNVGLQITSRNGFPTSSGLASSASGFAALAAGLECLRAGSLLTPAADPSALAKAAELARTLSASAARSIYGGFVQLEVSGVAEPVAPADFLPLRVLVCVTSESQKKLSSSEGMRITRAKSMYYATWVEQAPLLYREMKACLLTKDFDGLGELLEMSALAMHASAIAAGVVYWSGATLAAYAAVRELRAQGVSAWASMDAGPHVKVFVQEKDSARAKAALSEVSGVLRIIEAAPGQGVRCSWLPGAAS
jgi:diphosphomevalonate decarboxylase